MPFDLGVPGAPIEAIGGEPEPGETLARVEAWLLRRILEANQQQRAHAARQLGIAREGLYKKRPTSIGIAKILRNRGLAGFAQQRRG